MTENTSNNSKTTKNANSSKIASGQTYYNKMRKQLGDLLQERREIEQALVLQEELIAKKEQEYSEETPMGNIISGFDNYTKGGIVSGRRRGREEEERERRLRVFSRSSVSWNPSIDQSDVDQNTQTPSTNSVLSTTNSQKTENIKTHTVVNTASTTKGLLTKKHKKGADDSESEGRESKQVRVNFGASRK